MKRNLRAPRWSWWFVGIVLVCAAYAPLIASDTPIVLQSDVETGWRLPLFRSLSWAGWMWIVTPVLCALMYLSWRAVRTNRFRVARLLVFAAIIMTLIPFVTAGLRWWTGDPLPASLQRQSTTSLIAWIGLFGAGVVLVAVTLRRMRCFTTTRLLIQFAAMVILSVASAKFGTVDRPILNTMIKQHDSVLHTLIAHGPDEVDLERRNQPPGARSSSGALHLLGTDDVGADVLARLVHGCRTALLVGLSAAAIGLGLGVLLGLVMGYFGGVVDLLVMRLIELFMAVPRLFVILAVVVFLPTRASGTMLVAVVLVIGLTGWMRPARLMRSEVLRIRRSEYVLAARAYGASHVSILLRHIMPNALGPVLVDVGFAVAAAILMETNLSFLGLGVQPPTASWGAMLSQAVDRSTGSFHWWLAIGPGVLVAGTVLACNSLSDAARERLNRPDSQGKSF